MSDVIDFSFDEAKVIKPQGIELFKQTRSGEKHRVSLISFKKFHDVILATKAKEKGAPLSDAEKAEFISKIEKNLADKLGKPEKELTEIDRLDITSPKFSYAFTHYGDGVGTIRCLSKYEGNNVLKQEICCDKYGDADQTVATVCMTYPVDSNFGVDEDLLKARKYTNIYVWRLGSKKFQKVDQTYKTAKEDNKLVIDLKVTLDGDPKYQKQTIEAAASAFWARDGVDPAIRTWVLEQGLRAYKHVGDNLGYAMSKEKLLERLSGSAPAFSGGEEEKPKLSSGYNSLLE
jgi:hypothetical protein